MRAKSFLYPSPDVDPPSFEVRSDCSNKFEAGLALAPQHDAEHAWLHMANPQGRNPWKVGDIVMKRDRPGEVVRQPVAHPRPSPSPHLYSRTRQNKASSCVRSIPPGKRGNAASMPPPCGLMPRQPEKEQTREGTLQNPWLSTAQHLRSSEQSHSTRQRSYIPRQQGLLGVC